MKIQTDRLIIRPFKFSDDFDLYEMCSDIETAKNAGWTPHAHLEVTRNVIVGYMYSGETFAIMHRATKKVIGTISLYENTLRKNINCRELGFCLNKKYRNQGLMYEAVMAILDYGFNNLKLDLIMVCHHDSNEACRQLIKKTPFVYEGTLRMYRTIYHKKVIDGVMYSLKREEYNDWSCKR